MLMYIGPSLIQMVPIPVEYHIINGQYHEAPHFLNLEGKWKSWPQPSCFSSFFLSLIMKECATSRKSCPKWVAEILEYFSAIWFPFSREHMSDMDVAIDNVLFFSCYVNIPKRETTLKIEPRKDTSLWIMI